MTAAPVEIRPQAGPQEAFLRSSADVVVYGGSAGGGKTHALLMEDLFHKDNARFGSVTVRRTFQQIDQEGGLWQEAIEMYKPFGVKPNESKHRIRWPSGARSSFIHLQHEKDVYNYQGGQINLLKIDEGTHFNAREIFYLIGRTRSMSGIKSYTRISCNPDPDSFLVCSPTGTWGEGLISWWIDDDGWAIPQRSGIVRWFARHPDDDRYIFADSKKGLLDKYPFLSPEEALSITFILARLKDNQKLLEKDPQYKARLMLLPKIDRERLLGDENKGGNWKIKEAAGAYFKRSYFEILEEKPANIARWFRIWDFAATEPHAGNTSPDYTANVLVGQMPFGRICYADGYLDRISAGKLDMLFLRYCLLDGPNVIQCIPLDPAAAGRITLNHFITLQGKPRNIPVIGYPQMKGKSTEAHVKPASALAENGYLCMVRGPWNDKFFTQLEEYPDGKHDDAVSVIAQGAIQIPPPSSSAGKSKAAGVG